eukprot:2468556-Pleurochrysis_carterae.AAC.1
MYVRWTGGRMDVGPGKEVGELSGEEFSCVVGVERANEALRRELRIWRASGKPLCNGNGRRPGR